MKLRGLTVTKLIEQLKTLPQDAICVTPSYDHSYREINCVVEANADLAYGHLSEWDEDCPEPFGEIVNVVVIGI